MHRVFYKKNVVLRGLCRLIEKVCALLQLRRNFWITVLKKYYSIVCAILIIAVS
jgi:hypothetical protein